MVIVSKYTNNEPLLATAQVIVKSLVILTRFYLILFRLSLHTHTLATVLRRSVSLKPMSEAWGFTSTASSYG